MLEKIKYPRTLFENHSITSIYIRGMAVIFFAIFLLVGYTVYSEYKHFDSTAQSMRSSYIKDQKNSITFDINRVLKFIASEYYVRKLTVDEGLLKRQIINAISKLYGRPDQTGYIFIYSHKGICLADPVQPYNIGKNLYDYKDPNGVQVIKDLIDISKQKNGGFVTYTWVKPTNQEKSPKISYARSFEQWGWMVGTGVYLDEVDKAIASKKRKLQEKLTGYLWKLIVLITFLFLMGLIGVKSINYIIRREIKSFNHFFKKASREHILIEDRNIKFKEFKKMTKYINRMVDEIHDRESRLKELNRTLEIKINQKTQSLLEQNTLLVKEQEFNETLLKAQDSFIKKSIHEMNTPLAVIMTHIDIYRMKHGDDRYMSNIEAGAKMIATLYDDLSYMIKKDRFEYEIVKIDFSEFLHERVRFFQEIAAGNKHAIETSIDPHIKVYFSDIELQRVIDNNLSNAIKYAKAKTAISIRLQKEKKGIVLEFVTISSKIEDTKKIFEPFHREDKKIEGFGLGLEIVKSICDDHNVKIDVSSQNSKTSFQYIFTGEFQ